MFNVLILERFISISSGFQTTDNNTLLAASPDDLRGAMGEISNFYNFSPRLLIFDTHIPPITAIHAATFH